MNGGGGTHVNELRLIWVKLTAKALYQHEKDIILKTVVVQQTCDGNKHNWAQEIRLVFTIIYSPEGGLSVWSCHSRLWVLAGGST